MPSPKIIAYHAIWSAYGFWLPNEQRGSWSTEVWAPHLKCFGSATKTDQRRSLASKPYDRELRREMRDSLLFPPVRFSLDQIDRISRGFSHAIDQFNIVLHACAIMWDHVHIVAARHLESIEFVARVLKSAATRRLTADGLHPLASFADPTGRTPTPWTEGGWERYLHSESEIRDAVEYVEGNPEKHGLQRQSWSFVRPNRD